jgi:hypothetical protein
MERSTTMRKIFFLAGCVVVYVDAVGLLSYLRTWRPAISAALLAIHSLSPASDVLVAATLMFFLAFTLWGLNRGL